MVSRFCDRDGDGRCLEGAQTRLAEAARGFIEDPDPVVARSRPWFANTEKPALLGAGCRSAKGSVDSVLESVPTVVIAIVRATTVGRRRSISSGGRLRRCHI